MRKDRNDLITRKEYLENYLSEKIRAFEEQNSVKIKDIDIIYAEDLEGYMDFYKVKINLEV